MSQSAGPRTGPTSAAISLLSSRPCRCRVTAAEPCGRLRWLSAGGVPSWPFVFSSGPAASVIVDHGVPIPRFLVGKPDPKPVDPHDPFAHDLAFLHSAGSRSRVTFLEQLELFRWLSAGGVLS